ncbi:hypothetical protein [Desulfosarcina cetonica]|uniref:hypothetical protein n=1 Tax=Desulfosarcina cetonica TaxID=90730 RepID=UPI001FF00BBB|nr:hypothetical protein [Desulfosarcina cetonica]
MRTMQSDAKLIDVALGRAPGDLAIVNARLVNVYTGEILDGQSVCTSGAWIACVGEDVGHAIGPQTQVIDAAGATLIPGLIDGHAHLAWLFTAGEFLRHAARGGTTSIVTETLEVYPVAGLPGMLDFLASLADQPIRFFATAPSMVSISRAATGIDPADLRQLWRATRSSAWASLTGRRWPNTRRIIDWPLPIPVPPARPSRGTPPEPGASNSRLTWPTGSRPATSRSRPMRSSSGCGWVST